MADEFTPITSQEQFDAAIKDRIARAEKKAIEPFADYETLRDKASKFDDATNAAKSVEDKAAERIAEMQKQIDGLTGKLTESESSATRARIQAKHGISDEDAAMFLTATDAEALENQAKTLAERIGDRKKRGPRVPEQKDINPKPADDDDGLRSLVRSMRGE